MSGVEFQEEKYKSFSLYKTKTPFSVKLVMKLSGGLIDSERVAQFTLFIFIFIAVFISTILLSLNNIVTKEENQSQLFPSGSPAIRK